MSSLGATHIAETAAPRRATAARRAAFCVVALFIVLAPMFPHLFDLRSPFLRSWKMYSDVGVGILKGAFRIDDGVSRRDLSPLQVMGLERYPRLRHFLFEHRVRESGDVARLAEPFCATLAPGVRLSFDGAVGTRQGWRPLQVENICAGAHASRD